MTTTLLAEVVGIVEEYLGPSADRFIKRQITFHLSKKPVELTKQDLPKLVEWVELSLALLTEDKSMVDACEKKLSALGSN